MVDVLSGLARACKRKIMIYQTIGLALFFIGCLHFQEQIACWEIRIVRIAQATFNQQPWNGLFKEIWFLGKTATALIILGFITCFNWKLGALAGLLFLIIGGIEQLLKRLVNRSRPFHEQTDIKMLQPLEPADPSFPSGDALRVWYLALILPVAAGNSLAFFIMAVLLAVLVTLGRLVMGVHYLTDSLAGMGLGMLGAGTTIWLWTMFNLI